MLQIYFISHKTILCRQSKGVENVTFLIQEKTVSNFVKLSGPRVSRKRVENEIKAIKARWCGVFEHFPGAYDVLKNSMLSMIML